MRDLDTSKHFHAVTICRKCAEINNAAVFPNYNEVVKFFSGMKEGMSKASEAFPDKVDVEILIPNEVARLTSGTSHLDGHDVILLVHECADDVDFCLQMHMMDMAQHLASKMMNMLAQSFNKDAPEPTPANKDDDKARRLLESLNLSDDLFKGIN